MNNEEIKIDSAHYEGKTIDSRLPPRGPFVPISEELVELIKKAEIERSKGVIPEELRVEIVELAFDYLTTIGVHGTLLQYGQIQESGGNKSKKYFFAGNYELNDNEEVIYDLLPQSKESDIFQAVIRKKKDEIL